MSDDERAKLRPPSRAIGAAAAGEVAGAYFSFTEVTDPSQHRAYNEWHQLDHLPEQLPLAGVVSGQRWVATPQCQALRTADDGTLSKAQYVTVYLMKAPLARTIASFRALAQSLRLADRFFPSRKAHLAAPFRVIDAKTGSGLRLSPAAIPFRPNRGIYLCADLEGDEESQPQPVVASQDRNLDSDLASIDLASIDLASIDLASIDLASIDGVAGVWTFASDPSLDSVRSAAAGLTITLCYLDRPPHEMARTLGACFLRRGKAHGKRPVLAGPFASIQPWRWDWFDDDILRSSNS